VENIFIFTLNLSCLYLNLFLLLYQLCTILIFKDNYFLLNKITYYSQKIISKNQTADQYQ
jgi:hypothetical protein